LNITVKFIVSNIILTVTNGLFTALLYVVISHYVSFQSSTT